MKENKNIYLKAKLEEPYLLNKLKTHKPDNTRKPKLLFFTLSSRSYIGNDLQPAEIPGKTRPYIIIGMGSGNEPIDNLN